MSARRALLAAARIGFRHHLAYRTEVVMQLVSASLVAALNGSLWTAAMAAAPTIAGLPTETWRTNILIAWVGIGAIATRVHEDIGGRFRDGQIAADLLRPLSLQAGSWARDLGRATAAFGVNALPLLGLCGLMVPLRWPERPGTWLLWSLSIGLAHLANFGLSFLLGLAALRLKNVIGLSYLKATLVTILSGALIPLELLPDGLRQAAFALPFHALARTPAQIFLERGAALPLLVEQAAWGLGLWGLGALAWRRVSDTLTLEGG